jgi:hypothetical protein
VTQDIDHPSILVKHKEAAPAPRLIRKRMDDLQATSDGLRVHRIYIINLDRYIGLAFR